MAGEIARMVRHLRSFTEKRQERDIFVIIRSQHAPTVLDLNTGQLMEGRDSQGQLLDPPYQSRNYAEFKLMLNPKGVVDLKLTGKFHNSFFIRAAGNFPISIWARDNKTNSLVAKYGTDLFGLDKNESIPFLIQQVTPDIVDGYYRNKVFRLR